MASTKMKVASALFLFSFSMWIAIVWSVCFPNGTWANPIQFPTSTSFPLFIVSAATASIACMIIGFEYLGMGSENTKDAKTIEELQVEVPAQESTEGIESDNTITGNYQVLFNFEDPVEKMNMLVLARSNDLMASPLKATTLDRNSRQRHRDSKTGRFLKKPWVPETFVDAGGLDLEEKLKNKPE
jgi:hypothetical protein